MKISLSYHKKPLSKEVTRHHLMRKSSSHPVSFARFSKMFCTRMAHSIGRFLPHQREITRMLIPMNVSLSCHKNPSPLRKFDNCLRKRLRRTRFEHLLASIHHLAFLALVWRDKKLPRRVSQNGTSGASIRLSV